MFGAVSRFFATRVPVIGRRVAKALGAGESWPMRMGRQRIIGLQAALALGTLSGCHGVGPPQVGVGAPTAGPRIESLTPAVPFPAAMRHGELAAPDRMHIPPNVSRALALRPVVRLRLTEGSTRVRLVVSMADRTLSLLEGGDTLLQMPVAVASGLSLVYGGRAWRFQTPPGERRVLRKVANPVWTPPDWHYAEAASDHGLRLAPLPPSGTTLSGGRRLEIRRGVVGIIWPGEAFRGLPTDEHIVFDGRLFIPPIGTLNRRIEGDLGRFALDLGQGYMIHGTLDEGSIGDATTHGCIRVGDDDLAWLYENVPVGTRVVIH